MPKLKDLRKIINVTLPSNAEIKIKMRDGLLAGDIDVIDTVEGQTNKSLTMLTKMIIEWNLEGDDGKPLPITVDNVKQLTMTDVNHLLNSVTFVKDFLAEADKPK